jgi:hypothetical protein
MGGGRKAAVSHSGSVSSGVNSSRVHKIGIKASESLRRRGFPAAMRRVWSSCWEQRTEQASPRQRLLRPQTTQLGVFMGQRCGLLRAGGQYTSASAGCP